jgi:hypothetical protein
MRLHLIIAIIALAALAVAQTTQTGPAIQIINLPSTIDTSIGELAYNFVNQRTGPNVVAVPLPAAAYKDYGNIKLIVVAIPYSPEEDPDQAISNAINELVSNDPLNTRINNAVSDLLSIRSVFYPYETFRIRLIFIMFVHTQDLIDYAIQASQNLYSGTPQGQSPDPDEAAALYTNTIMEILNAKYQNWQNSELQQLEDEVNGFTLQSQQSGDTIQFTGTAGGTSALTFSVTVKLQVTEKTEGNKTITICNLSSTVNNINQEFTSQLASQISSTLPTLTQDEISRVFAGIKVDVNNFNYVIKKEYYSNVVNSAQSKYNNIIINYIKQTFTMTETESCNSQSCSCENLKNQFISSILQETNTVEGQLKYYYVQMLNDIDTNILGNLSVVNSIANSLCGSGDQCSDIQSALAATDLNSKIQSAFEGVTSVAQSCIGEYLGDVAEEGINSLVSTIPGVDLAYAVANGIFGALQNEITISGTIVSEPANLNGFELAGGLRAFKVYNVSSEVACYSSDIRDVSGQNFVSGPSPSEAILAGIKGFFSAIVQLFSPEAGQVVDLIPIVREVDMPQNGYFMFGSTPGIYVLKITNLNAQNIIEQFKQDMESSIENALEQSYEIGSSSELYKDINKVVEDVLQSSNIGNFAKLYDNAYGKNYDYNSKVNDNTGLTLSLYFVVIPPYMVGEGLGSGYINYAPSADIFGLLRSFFFPAIGDIRQKMIQTLLQPSTGADFCSQSGQPTLVDTSIGNLVSSLCSNAVDNIINNMLQPIINNIVQNIMNNFNIESIGSQDCSVAGLLAYATENAISVFKSDLQNQINNYISTYIFSPLSQQIKSGICTPLGGEVNRLAGGALSSLFGDLLGAYGAFSLQGQTPDITGAICGLMGGSQTIRYLGLYATKVFDAVEEGLYVPSYFLSAYPIEFEESPTVQQCYGVVVSPYFIYVQPTVNPAFIQILSQNPMYIQLIINPPEQLIINLPVLVGVNKYFDALEVYPAIVVRENGNPNPYYFVVPYSTPARELYVLGTAGNVVIYDGSTAGQTNKPFIYYDISK